MKSYKVRNIRVMARQDGYTLHAVMLEPHASGIEYGKTVVTSSLRLIDFERGIAVTKNSIYLWEPK